MIKGRAEIDRLPGETPVRLRDLLTRCLRKDPKQRFRDIGDVRYELEAILASLSATPDAAPAAVPSVRPIPAWVWAAAIALAAVTGGAGVAWLTRPGPQPIVRVTAVHPGDEVVQTQLDADVAFSPDGRRIAYLARGADPAESPTGGRLYVRDLEQLVPRLLAEAARTPFFSPDGQWVGFVDDRDRAFYRVAVTGGPPVRIGSMPGRNPRGASWSPDGRIVFSMAGQNFSGLWSIPAEGGEPSRLTTADAARGEQAHLYPEVLPGRRAVLFTIQDEEGSPDDRRIAVLNLETGTHEVLIQGGSNPRYAASGHIVYAAAGGLRAIAFDLGRLAVRGTPVPVQDGVVVKATGAASFTLSPAGTLAYVAGASLDGPARGGLPGTLVWVDREGREEAVPAEARVYNQVRVSPDGEHLAVLIALEDLWIYEMRRGVLRRLTRDQGQVGEPVWTPDGRRVTYFATRRDDVPGIFWRAADGSGDAERLTRGLHLPSSWSPDGRHLLYTDAEARHIAMMSPADPSSVQVLAASQPPDRADHGVVSPDGRWVAYQSNETGQPEVYVRAFSTAENARWLMSIGGGVQPVWAPDGATLYYYDRNGGAMMAVAVGAGVPSTWGRPSRLFEHAGLGQGLAAAARRFDIAPDGRFLLIQSDTLTGGSREIVIVQHWFDELTRLAP